MRFNRYVPSEPSDVITNRVVVRKNLIISVNITLEELENNFSFTEHPLTR